MTDPGDNFDNPYRAPAASTWPMAPLGVLTAHLVERAWWRRRFDVATESRVFDVVYNGRGLGYEEVLVDGRRAVRK